MTAWDFPARAVQVAEPLAMNIPELQNVFHRRFTSF
jgi:hypothetical protein